MQSYFQNYTCHAEQLLGMSATYFILNVLAAFILGNLLACQQGLVVSLVDFCNSASSILNTSSWIYSCLYTSHGSSPYEIHFVLPFFANEKHWTKHNVMELGALTDWSAMLCILPCGHVIYIYKFHNFYVNTPIIFNRKRQRPLYLENAGDISCFVEVAYYSGLLGQFYLELVPWLVNILVPQAEF